MKVNTFWDDAVILKYHIVGNFLVSIKFDETSLTCYWHNLKFGYLNA